jgi:hypothetical protein
MMKIAPAASISKVVKAKTDVDLPVFLSLDISEG